MIQEFLSVSEAINKYGTAAILLAAIITVFMVYANRINKSLKQFTDQTIKNNENYQNSMTKQNDKIIEEILSTRNEMSKTPSQKDLFKTFTKLSKALKEYCKDIMTTIKADRLAIYLFHDGAYSTHGIHFFKMSCICEKVLVGSGVRERSIEHSNLPINLFDDMIEQLISNGIYIIDNDGEALTNSNHRIFISANKIKYSQTIAIFDKDNNIIGFVLAEMDSEKTDEAIANNKKILQSFINQIIPVLTYSDYVEINLDNDNN